MMPLTTPPHPSPTPQTTVALAPALSEVEGFRGRVRGTSTSQLNRSGLDLGRLNVEGRQQRPAEVAADGLGHVGLELAQVAALGGDAAAAGIIPDGHQHPAVFIPFDRESDVLHRAPWYLQEHSGANAEVKQSMTGTVDFQFD